MKKFLKEICPYIIILMFKKFVAAPVRVIGPSMKDTLLNGDIMILNKISYRFSQIRRFDIVVVDYDDLIIKRVIGIPGDSISYKDNKLYINNKYVEEPFLVNGTKTNNFDIKDISGYDKIPNGYYLVLGDNREESKDSRIIGLIPRKKIEGKANFIIFPFSRIGSKNYK